ncbi:hypothetical protein SMJ63A_50193 [Stenotrophomonas geniculata]
MRAWQMRAPTARNTATPISPSPSIGSGSRRKPMAAAIVASTISTTTATDSPAPGGPGSPNSMRWVSRLSSLIAFPPGFCPTSYTAGPGSGRVRNVMTVTTSTARDALPFLHSQSAEDVMAHQSRLAGFIIDCQDTPAEEGARFWAAALGLQAQPSYAEDGAEYADLQGAPAGPERGSTARRSPFTGAPGHRERRHRRRGRPPGEARRAPDRLRQTLVGNGSTDRPSLLHRAHARARGACQSLALKEERDGSHCFRPLRLLHLRHARRLR